MGISVNRDGKFIFQITSEMLKKGLRENKNTLKNSGGAIQCSGMVGINGVLKTLENLVAINTSIITDGFPYPQLFVFVNLILICGKYTIYEYDPISSTLISKFTGSGYMPWSAVDFYNFIYLTNGIYSVTRDSKSKIYSIDYSLPAGYSLCNFNGQVLVGSPNNEGEI